MFVIETDENQHKSYNQMDEEIRYNDLMMVHSGKWIYIRFNPDKFIAKNGKRKNPEIATRLRILEKEIEKQIKRIEGEDNQELLERVYLYYDNYE
jgi:very-short-patch-repair endonuclease